MCYKRGGNLIIEGIMNVLKAVILFIVGLFPTLPNMSSLAQPIDAVISVVRTIDSFVSVQLAGVCIGFLFVFTHLDFIWSVIMWVIRKIPGVD
jgi:flagellar biosynthesis protein FlhB